MHSRSTIVLSLLLLMMVPVSGEDFMTRRWTFGVNEIISGMQVADLDGDGGVEVLVATSSEGALYAINREGVLEFRYQMPSYVFSLHVDDLDGDGKMEIMAGTGRHIYLIDYKGDIIVSPSYTGTGNQIHSISSGDLDGDGRKEVIGGSYDLSSCRSGNVHNIDSESRTTNWLYSLPGENIPSTVLADDLNKNGKAVIIVGEVYRAFDSTRKSCNAAYNRPGRVFALDDSKKVLWSYDTEGGVTVIKTFDLDGDGMKEILVGSYPNLYLLDANGAYQWKYRAVSLVHDVTAADVNGDGVKEVIIASDHVYALDNKGKVIWTGRTDDRVYSLAAMDLGGDNVPEIIAGSNKAYIFNASGKLTWNTPPLTTIDFVSSADLNRDGFPDLIVGAIKNVTVWESGKVAEQDLAIVHMSRATSLYRRGNYTGAYEEVKIAIRLYQELKNKDKVVEASDLKREIEKIIGNIDAIRESADNHLALAQQSYLACDYMNASRLAAIARNEYASPSMNYRKGIEDSDRVFNNARGYIKLNASLMLERARDSLNISDYGEAYYYLKGARLRYEFLKDDEALEQVARLELELNMTGIEGWRPPSNDTPMNLTSFFNFNISRIPFISNLNITSNFKALKLNPLHMVLAAILVFLILALLVLVLFNVRAFRRAHRRQYLSLEDISPRKKDALKAGSKDGELLEYDEDDEGEGENAPKLEIKDPFEDEPAQHKKHKVEDEPPAGRKHKVEDEPPAGRKHKVEDEPPAGRKHKIEDESDEPVEPEVEHAGESFCEPEEVYTKKGGGGIMRIRKKGWGLRIPPKK